LFEEIKSLLVTKTHALINTRSNGQRQVGGGQQQMVVVGGSSNKE